MATFHKISTIAEAHKVFHLNSPEHPLISAVNLDDPNIRTTWEDQKYILDLYYIALKEGDINHLGYGRNTYDFQDGCMIFMAPGQVITTSASQSESNISGWMLLLHPDLLRQSELGQKMDSYRFFSYNLSEALHLSTKEKARLGELIERIREEYNQNIDQHSQQLMISSIELLLNYCQRYYDRQFYTRSNKNKEYVGQFEALLKEYYVSDKVETMGLPTVAYCGEALHMSPKYLSDLLRKETGRNAQDHIHDFIIEKAKNILLQSNSSISEVAYRLGFEYPQYFSKIFKKKTSFSPSEYRKMN